MSRETNRAPEHLTRAERRAPEVDYVEAEHDPAASRRASNSAMQRTLGPYIQRKATGAAVSSTETTHAVAARGTQTPAQALPHAERIQAAFGPEHDVSKIRAHIDPVSAHAMGAEAYATGNDVVFAREPDVATAAHEAAHVVQQAQGVNLKGGVGEAGDAHEEHADAVAERVVAGQSATALLSDTASDHGNLGSRGQHKRSVSAPVETNGTMPRADLRDGAEATETAVSEPADRANRSPATAPVQLKSTAAAQAVRAPREAPLGHTPNPSYLDARLYAAKFFRRHGELALLLSQACRDGLQSFSIRSSEQYNKSDSMGLMIFELALAAVPAAGALVQTLHELSTSEKLRELTRLAHALKKVASASERAHERIGKIEGVTERVKKVTEVTEKAGAISEAGESKEKGDFEMATVSSLSDLMSDSVAARWRSEDFTDEMLESLEYTDPAVDLKAMVVGVLGPLPSPDAVKGAVSQVSQEFELKLYLQYYVESGKTTYVVDEQDGARRVDFEGIPRGVVRRFEELNRSSMLIDHPKMKHRKTVRVWSGNRV